MHLDKQICGYGHNDQFVIGAFDDVAREGNVRSKPGAYVLEPYLLTRKLCKLLKGDSRYRPMKIDGHEVFLL